MSRAALTDLLLRDPAALIVVKATFVLALASAAAVAAKGFSAARRHTLWLVTLCSCVWLLMSARLVPAVVLHTAVLGPTTVVETPEAAAPSPAPPRATPRAPSAPTAFAHHHTARTSSSRSIPLSNHPLVAVWIVG